MKKLFLAFAFLFIFCQCSSNSGNNGVNHDKNTRTQNIADSLSANPEGPFLFVAKPKYDFGTVKIKNTPEIFIDFEFKNIGTEPLVILQTDVSCGCVSVEYPKNPVMSGEKGVIKVSVDTKGQEGSFNKTVYVKSNANNDELSIVGQIG